MEERVCCQNLTTVVIVGFWPREDSFIQPFDTVRQHISLDSASLCIPALPSACSVFLSYYEEANFFFFLWNYSEIMVVRRGCCSCVLWFVLWVNTASGNLKGSTEEVATSAALKCSSALLKRRYQSKIPFKWPRVVFKTDFCLRSMLKMVTTKAPCRLYSDCFKIKASSSINRFSCKAAAVMYNFN